MTSGSPIEKELDEIKRGIVDIQWFLLALIVLGVVWFTAWLLR